jgi:hypothetical protein
MKAVVAEFARKHLLVLVVGFLSTFSFAGSASSQWLAQNQNCSSNCASLKASAASNPAAKSNTRIAAITPAERVSGSHSMDLNSGSTVHAMTSAGMRSESDQGAIDTQANKSPATDGASTPGASFFLLLGLALIGIRLVISYRSRKLKNLAAQTD